MRRLSAALIFLLVFSALLCLAAPPFLEADTARAMIDGLDGLRLLSPEEAKTFPRTHGQVELTLAGAPLPYDAEANAYLIPQSAETEGFDGAVELRREAGYTYYLCPSAAGGKAEALSGNVEYGIYGRARGGLPLLPRPLYPADRALPHRGQRRTAGRGARGGRSGGLLRPRWPHRARTGACGGQRARQYQPPLPQEELPTAHPECAGRQAPSGHRRPAKRRRLDLEPPLRRHLEDTRTARL